MHEVVKINRILTINDVAAILRCSKTRCSKTLFSHVVGGKIVGIPKLAHVAMGRRKLVRRAWPDQWSCERIPALIASLRPNSVGLHRYQEAARLAVWGGSWHSAADRGSYWASGVDRQESVQRLALGFGSPVAGRSAGTITAGNATPYLMHSR